ncbi:MAG TPA: membrane protein insertion efficiency factor YidD [Planctomycetaceae bacterium]|nr:membrane protein insertion efficiency factor YidD [Planctomycetaceae bacterium]HIQ21704.1 membrane protein insertion efficiency factor YidD [Planctomycetota bacterium]
MRLLARIASTGSTALSWILISFVRAYQTLLSPLLGRRCRFEPTCSQYFIGAVRKYGPLRGTLRGVARICRCHPWHPGGYDPP